MDPEVVIQMIVGGQFFEGIIYIYTSMFGYMFWGIIFFITTFGLYMRSRSLGMVLFYTMVFGVALLSWNVLPSPVEKYVVVIAALCMAAILWYAFIGRGESG